MDIRWISSMNPDSGRATLSAPGQVRRFTSHGTLTLLFLVEI